MKMMINIFFDDQYRGQLKNVAHVPLQPLYPPGRIIHIVRHHPKQRFSFFCILEMMITLKQRQNAIIESSKK